MVSPNCVVMPRTDKISFGDVGISIAYKNKFKDLFFDSNRDGEDFDFINKLLFLTKNYTITPEIYYNVNH